MILVTRQGERASRTRRDGIMGCREMCFFFDLKTPVAGVFLVFEEKNRLLMGLGAAQLRGGF